MFTFILVSSLFLLWGLCNGMIDVMDKHFQDELGLTKSQSAWVQFAALPGVLPDGDAGRLAGDQAGLQRRHHRGPADGGGGRILVPAGDADQCHGPSRHGVGNHRLYRLPRPGSVPSPPDSRSWKRSPTPTRRCSGRSAMRPPASIWPSPATGSAGSSARSSAACSFYSIDAAGRSTGSETLYIPYVDRRRSSSSLLAVDLLLCLHSRHQDRGRLPPGRLGTPKFPTRSGPHPHFAFAVLRPVVAERRGPSGSACSWLLINYMTGGDAARPRLVASAVGEEPPIEIGDEVGQRVKELPAVVAAIS